MKRILIIVTLILIMGCKKENKSNTPYSIDLSVKYNSSINSYKIEADSSVVILLNKTYEVGRLYKSKLNQKEFDSIQYEISQISKIQCDSTDSHYLDGMNYLLILKSNDKKITLISNTCDNYERVDNFVIYLVKMFDKRKKDEFFESIILPPPPELQE